MTDTKLIALGLELEAHAAAEAHYALHGLPTGEAEAAEEDRLAAWSETILKGIAAERPTTPEGWAVKLRAVAYCNATGELTPADRIAHAETLSDGLAWAIVRDLMEAQAA